MLLRMLGIGVVLALGACDLDGEREEIVPDQTPGYDEDVDREGDEVVPAPVTPAPVDPEGTPVNPD